MRRSITFLATMFSGIFALMASAWDGPLDVSQLPPPIGRKVDFVREVEPILRRHCHACHGPQERESGLRLDLKKDALAGGDNGVCIVAGMSDKSRLIHLVAGLDSSVGRMPPADKSPPLSREQIGLLRAWIDQGASWPDDLAPSAAGRHWSFLPIAHQKPKSLANATWCDSPIDTFILERLQDAQIAPSRRADPTTLFRRLYLDLVGLLPEPHELDEFLSDTSPDALERVIDRLLGSPAFGERWGRHWLDAARYADSDGYEKDSPRPLAWRYREWVIRAVNADMPYDEFSLQQLAGDLLDASNADAKVAAGFHRNTLHNTEGGTDPEEDRVKKTIDRTNTLGTIWLGLTVGCAQCHSHKYDPISQQEYFSLLAFFNSMDEVEVEAPTPRHLEQLAEQKHAFQAEHERLKRDIEAYETTQLAAAGVRWEQEQGPNPTVWTALRPDRSVSQEGAELKVMDDSSILATGKNQLSDIYTVEATVPAVELTAIRLEVLPDEALPKRGPGRAAHGNFVLATFSVSAQRAAATEADTQVLTLARAHADFSQNDWSVERTLNQESADGWAVSPQIGARHVAVFELQKPVALEPGTRLIFRLDQHYKGPEPHNLGRFRLSISTNPAPVAQEGVPQEIALILATPAGQRSGREIAKLSDYYRPLDAQLAKLTTAVTEHLGKAPKLPAEAKAQSIAELATPRETRIHLRGDFLSPGDSVELATLTALPAIESKRPNRVALSQWLFHPANPLTARVAANRIWQRLFLRGIVPTLDDFGSQGDPPSHPEALDWLASDFRDSGWSVKRLVRRLVNSATYRQSSAVRPELVAVDPENSLFARQVRGRVEAEIVRDVWLDASGLLDARIGGPSVRPRQPEDHAKLTYANSANWKNSEGGDAYRRGMYTFFQRTSPYPMLATFDVPDSNECCVRRISSNTALQSLTLWNDPVFFEMAQALGRRLVTDVTAPADERELAMARIRYLFRVCLAREPQVHECSELVELWQRHVELLTKSNSVDSIIGKGPLPSGIDGPHLAAWVLVARTVVNLDEFITRE